MIGVNKVKVSMTARVLYTDIFITDNIHKFNNVIAQNKMVGFKNAKI